MGKASTRRGERERFWQRPIREQRDSGASIKAFCRSQGSRSRHNGGRTAGVLFSITANCTRHGIDPFRYLADVLRLLVTSRPTGWLSCSPTSGSWPIRTRPRKGPHRSKLAYERAIIMPIGQTVTIAPICIPT